MIKDGLQPLAEDFKITFGKWLLVFENIEHSMLFEQRTIWFFFPKKVRDIICPGYKIVCAKRLWPLSSTPCP